MARSEWVATTRLIDAAIKALEQEHPMTVRQTFYQLVSVHEIENCRRDYQRVSRVLTKARDDGRIDFGWIADRSRPTYEAATWDDLEEYGDTVLLEYRRNNWQEQRCHVEILCEKDSVSGSIQEITDKWAVPLRTLRGFNSTTRVHEIATLFAEKNRQRKHVFVFYLGDWDPSGEAIEMDVYRRIVKHGSGSFIMLRLAIHQADIAKFNLPPLRVKPSDSRAARFIRKHGRKTVELDALPPTELRRRVDEAIRGKVNMKAWNRAVVVEAAERETTKRIALALGNGGQL
jgi:hypothetical protein